MKVLFLSHYFFPEGNAPATRVYNLAKKWVSLGHEVTVITCAPNVPVGRVYKGYKNACRSIENIDGIRVVRVWTFIAANKGTILRILNYVSYLFSALFWAAKEEKPDVMVATSPQFFCGWAGVKLKKKLGVPFVLEIRDIWPASILAVGAKLPKRLIAFLEKMEIDMYNAADHIVTVGEGYKAELLQKKVPEEKISIFMNGLDLERFNTSIDGSEVRKKIGINTNFVCSYIGTIGMASGLHVVLRAAALLHRQGRTDICFLLVGEGAIKEKLQDEAEERGLHNVIFTGRIDKDDIAKYIAASDACLVHLKKTELFESVMPSKLFEAGGMAKPVIIGVKGQATELVLKAGMAISMEPENEEDLVKAVTELADNRERSVEMGESGRAYLTKHCDFNKTADEYASMLEAMHVSTNT